MDDVRLEARGLWTDPNELTTPHGALVEALNVRIKRVNVVEPRPGFVDVTIEGPADPAWNAFPWMRSMYVATGDGLWRHLDADGDVDDGEVVSADGSLVLSQDTARGAAMGRNFYVVTDEGVYRIAEPGSLAATLGGIPQGSTPVATLISGSGLPNNDAVSIRVVFADMVNDQLLLGAPSAPLRVANATGSAKGVSMEIGLPAGVVAGMSIQIYRTLDGPAADPTGDEMALAQEHTVTSGEVTAGFATVTTMTAIEVLGAALYTNETQEGILQANTRPPRAKCIAWFHQMAFFADVRALDEEVISGTSKSGVGVSGIEFIGGLSEIFSGTTTSGSPTITFAAGPIFQVGNYISTSPRAALGAAPIQALSRVVSFTATSVTLDKNATSSTTATLYTLAVLTVDGEEFINGYSDTANRQFGTWTDLIALVDRYTDITLTVNDPDASVTAIVLRGMDSFDVSYESVSASTTLVGLWNSTPTESAPTAAYPARLMWSKLDQPEAVPALNFVDIGDYRQPIMALAPTRDSLFVMKADGVWCVTGDTPETLRVEAYDSTLHLIHRRACDTHENAVWAWTTQGIVAITEAGTERVGAPIANLVAGQAETIRDATTPVGGVFIASCTQQRCVLVGVPESDAASSPAEFTGVYESESTAWTRWQSAAYPWRGAVEYGGRIVIVGGTDGASVGIQGAARDSVDDVEVTALAAGLRATITGLNGADSIGALVDRGDSAAWVTDYIEDDEYTMSSLLTVGEAEASYPIPTYVQWAAAPTSGSLVHWRQMRAQLGGVQNTYRVNFGFVSERVPEESTVYTLIADPATPRQPTALRMMVSRAQARCARLRPSMSTRSALQTWTLEGLTLTGEPMRGSERMP